MRDELKEWLLSLNGLAKDLYGTEWRISTALEKYSFSKTQIAFLKADGLEAFLHNIDFALQCRLLCGSNGMRFFKIVYQRYGLFGCAKQTLQTIGEEMGISRERVRQLEEKALRRLKPTKILDVLETLTVIAACHALQVGPSVLLSAESGNECDTPMGVFEEYGENN